MSAVLDRPTAVFPRRLGFLMGLYAENYCRLTRLFAPQRLAEGRYLSDVDDGLTLHMHIQQRHPYTLELSLSYGFLDEDTGMPSPSAQLRMYTDARLAEAQHCYCGRLCKLLDPFLPSYGAMQHRLRINGFFNRWLEYLAEQGHSMGTLQRSGESVLQ